MDNMITATARAAAFEAALARAYERTRTSAFDNHVIGLDDGSYEVIDEGDIGPMEQALIDRICHTAPGCMSGLY